MKKRIGTKLYDTDTSNLILDMSASGITCCLYQKRTRDKTFFIRFQDDIRPISDDEAREQIECWQAGNDGKGFVNEPEFERHSSDTYTVRLTPESYEKLKAISGDRPMSETLSEIVMKMP